MKVLFVNHLLDPVSGGGTAERTFQIARFLAQSGVDCTVLTLDIGLGAKFREQLTGVGLVAVPCRNRRFFWPSVSQSEVTRLVQSFDLVHLSGHWTILNGLVFRACVDLRKPYLFCPAGALKPFGRSLWLKRLYDFVVGQRIVESAAACVAITSDERADFFTRGVGESKIIVIPNGIDPHQYQQHSPDTALSEFRRDFGLGDTPYILFLGRLNAIKGPDLLLDAFASVSGQFPNHHLVFAGPADDMGASLQVEARALGVAERVHFTGFIGGQQKVAALRGAQLLVIPSRREAMSIVVLEAGACCCPALFTDTCGLADLADAGAGIMVAADAGEIADGVIRCLADPDRLAQSGQKLNEIVSREYLWSVQAERYRSVFEAIDSEKFSPRYDEGRV